MNELRQAAFQARSGLLGSVPGGSRRGGPRRDAGGSQSVGVTGVACVV